MRDPFAVGRSDLDALRGGMGGGMVFDPLRSRPRGPEFGGGLGGPSLPRYVCAMLECLAVLCDV